MLSAGVISTPLKTKERTDHRVYAKEEVLANALAYFQQDELAATTWLNKYALRNADGALVESSLTDMHRRMTREFTRIEASYPVPDRDRRGLLSKYGMERTALDEDRIFALFDGFRDVVPQGSVMASLGDPYRLASLSNCASMVLGCMPFSVVIMH